MANKFQHKRSSTGGATPTLSSGELAFNLLDKRLFTANDTTVFDAFQNTASNVAITSDGTMVLIVGNTTINAVVNSTSLKVSNSTSNTTLSVPSAAAWAATNYFLHANGSWVAVSGGSGSPGGSNTYIQYNDSGSFNGSAGFTFDESTNNVTIANSLTVDNLTITGDFSVNTDFITIGNSTSNATINSISLYLTNSSVNTIISVPTSAQWSSTNYVLHANGSWIAAPGGAGTPGGGAADVQYANNGTFAGNSGFQYTYSTNNVTIANTLTLGGVAVINSTYVGVGANTYANLVSVRVGNSIVNTVITNNSIWVGNATFYFSANQIALKMANATSNTTWPLPTATERGENRYLKVDGTWSTVTASAAAGGSNTYVQFNDSTAISGTAGFTFNKDTNSVYIANTLTVDGPLVINSDALAVGNDVVNTVMTGTNITINAYPVVGYQTIFVPAAAMVATTTSGAATGSLETTTNKQMLKTYDFDATANEFCQFMVRMPPSWDLGDIRCSATWSQANTTTNFGVTWGFQGYAYSNGDTFDQTWGSLAYVSHTGGVNAACYISNGVNVTIGGTPSAEDYLIIQVGRFPANTNDTMAVDAKLHGVTVFYNSMYPSDVQI